VVSWQGRAGTAPRTVTAKFTFDPSTNDLTYSLAAVGFSDGEILAATLHRAGKDGNGPSISLLTNRPFKSASGVERLSDPDREKLFAGGLYLRITTRSKATDNLRIVLKPM
jgi:hypothetical protein